MNTLNRAHGRGLKDEYIFSNGKVEKGNSRLGLLN